MSVNPSQITFSATNSVPVALEEGLLKRQVLGGQEFYECVVCQISMAGVVPAKSHLEGAKHLKALRKEAYTSGLASSFNNLLLSSNASQCGSPALECKREDSFPEDSNEYVVAMKRGVISENVVYGKTFVFCNVCKISCTGHASGMEHLRGEQHNKRLRRSEIGDHEERELNSSITGFEDQMLSDEDWVEEKYLLGSKHYHCKLCDKSCTGKENLEQHLIGRQHQKAKKQKYSIVMQSAPIQLEESTHVNHENKLMSTNQNCQEQAKLDNTIAESPLGLDGYHCKVCNITCTGPENFQQHLQGKAHRKQMMRGPIAAAPIQQRETYTRQAPTKPDTQPVKNPDTSGMVLETASGYFCLICEESCSDAVALTEHVLGDVHHQRLQEQINLQEEMISETKLAANCSSNTSLIHSHALPSCSSASANSVPAIASDINDIRIYLANEPLDDFFL